MAHVASERNLRRPQQFSHPSGRTVHVASNPEAAETLRRELTRTHGQDAFDLYIKGSDDHMKALGEAQAHHEQRRLELQKVHPEAWDEFERVHQELDALSTELGNLTNKGVALDANFDRFGYSAHIKTIEDDDAGSTSGMSRTLSAHSDNADRPQGEAIKLWRRPVVRQYFHKGLIWRASEEAQVSAMELFVDLIFVGLIAIMGDTASEEPTGEALLRFCVTLILSYQLWSSVTSISSWFVSNDLFQRLCIVFFTACLVGYSTNVQNAFDSTYTELIAFYLAGRLFNVAYYTLLYFLIPMIRPFLVATSIIILIPSALWIASIHVDYPNRLGFIWTAIALDLYGNGIVVPMFRGAERLENTWLKPLAQRAQFYPAINIEHRTERMNAFVTLVIGYSVVALLYQSNAPGGINAYFGKAILGLIIAVVFALIYFEIDSSNLYVHAIRRHAVAYMLWQQVHLPFVLSFTLASGALAKLVVAHDCQNTPIEALSDTFAAKSVAEIEPGLRWFFCGGLGVALLSTVVISASHDHKVLPGVRFCKRNRLLIRSLCSIVIIVLPTAGDRLNSLDLLSVVTVLLVLSLFVELWGCSDSEEGSFWADGRCCNYAAECKLSKKDLEALRKGEVGGVEELVKLRRAKNGERDRADIM